MDLSLTSLVLYKSSRKRLRNAEKMIDDGNFKNAVNEIAIAFDQLIDNYENKIVNILGKYHPLIDYRSSLESLSSYADDDSTDAMLEAITSNFEIV